MFGYWKRLWKAHPLSVVVALFWLFGQVWSSWIGAESFPFYNYGMYSQPSKGSVPQASAYQIVSGGADLSTAFRPGAWDLLSRNLDYYTEEWPEDSSRIVSNINSRFSGEGNLQLRERFSSALLPSADLGSRIRNWVWIVVQREVGNLPDTLVVSKSVQSRVSAIRGEAPVIDTLWVIMQSGQ